MKKKISTFLTLWAVWILLTGFDVIELVTGGVASLILALIISDMVDYSFDIKSLGKFVKFLLIYVPLFIIKMVEANLDMAYRVLSPSLPINPGFVKVPTDLKGNIGKLVLANSITLTPGTLSVDVDKDYVYVHCVNVKGDCSEDYQREVSGSFEKVLGGIFK